MTNSVCIITSSANSIIQFRLDLIKDILAAEKKVSVISFDFDEHCKHLLTDLGVDLISLKSKRTSISLVGNMKAVIRLYKKLAEVRPDTVLTYFIKPNIFRILVSCILGVKHRVMLLEGLGYIFTEQSVFVKYLLKNIIQPFYILAFNLSSKIIVLNDDDKKFVSKKLFFNKNKIITVKGIGVNLDQYFKINGIKKDYDFLFVGRYLKHKGINEFFSALKILKAKGLALMQLLLAVWMTIHLLYTKRTEDLVSDGLVENLGYCRNMNSIYNLSKVLVLPSYREARPRVVQKL